MSSNNHAGLIVGLGDLAADLIVEVPVLPIEANDLQVVHRIQVEPGGTANFLILASRLGAPTAALGVLGEDFWGQEVISILEDLHINLSLVDRSGSTTVALVLVDRAGRHAFIGKFGEGPALQWSDRHQAMLSNAAAIFSSGYSLREPRLAELTMAAFKQARELGVRRFFDPGPAFGEVETRNKERILALSEVLLLTEEEVPLVTNGGLRGIFKQGPEIVALKCGARGCEVHTPEGLQSRQPGLKVEVRDTTAAGDSFAAGFVIGMIRGWSLEECARLANAVGAAKVQKLGSGRNAPTLDDVRSIIERFGLDLKI